MTARILAGNVFDMLPTITPGSVDAVVTSPPYWMLRAYLPKDHPLKAQELGSEPTVQEFIGNMVRVFGLVRETMADHAVCFVNCGDTYASGNQGGGSVFSNGRYTQGGGDARVQEGRQSGKIRPDMGIESGNLCLIPQRLAIALQDDGWIIRSVIVWHKPSCMPASLSGWMWKRCRVKVAEREIPKLKWTEPIRSGDKTGQNVHAVDGYGKQAQWSDCPGCEKCEKNAGLVLRRGSWRPTSSWEPILMLAKSSSYYADGEAVKTPSAAATVSRYQYRLGYNFATAESHGVDKLTGNMAEGGDMRPLDQSGANPRDVQTWASEPLKLAHYAAFPTALVRFCLRAGTSLRGYCPTCGAPWARILEATPETEAMRAAARNGQDFYARNNDNSHKRPEGQKAGDNPMAYVPHEQRHSVSNTIGWKPTCRCPEQEPRPGLILDPFSGSARTGLTAIRMGLDYVGVELSPEYVEMSRKLLKQDSPLFSGGVE